MNSLTSPSMHPDLKTTGDGDIEKFESAFPDLDSIPQRESFGTLVTSSSTQPHVNVAGDNDFDKFESSFPDLESIPQQSFSSPQNVSFSAPAIPAPTQPDVKITGDDEMDKFESVFPDLEPISQPIFSPSPLNKNVSFSAPAFAPRPKPSVGFSTPILQAPIEEEEEPVVTREWREKQAESIRLRDEVSAQKRNETIANAERSIDEFYEEYNAKKERQIKENKESESAYLASLTDSLSAGTTWSRICDLIDLENSQSKTLARTGAGTTELSRYREILLRLRREGTAAPGAAGY